ncbi:3-dehydroquinate synthase [candidate division KSB1 bacterium]|nr:3-dehydroquinate synthase [candidate division KSB1 bacterium]MBL7092660.1 3-dehydroquinate synthase [candidate division KSB1 bacterium]
MRKVIVDLKERSYPIYIKSGIIGDIGLLCEKHSISKKVVLITDATVDKLYANGVACTLEKSNYQVVKIVVAVGEQSKSLETAEYIFEELIKNRIDRTATIIALGGGVIGDLAGFVAATYKRGISFVQIPTTLLAQTDSSVGGKVGINHRLGKNLIGAFYQPKFVLIDPVVLKTLDNRDVISGLGEVIKYGLIWEKKFFAKLEDNFNELKRISQLELYGEIIERCCSIKAEIVSRDEKETGLRTILNFGHTIGHALEAETNYQYFRHGEAVLWGMQAMSWLSTELDLLEMDDYNRIHHLLENMIEISLPSKLSARNILKTVYFDKKNIGNELQVVLLNGIGQALTKKNIEDKFILSAIKKIL